MGIGRTIFFATAGDLASNLRVLERQWPLNYALCGAWREPHVLVYAGVDAIPDFGVSATGNETGDTQYLVVPADTIIAPRQIKQKKGGPFFAVDGIAVNESLVFQHGGIFGDQTLISGYVAAVGNSRKVADSYRTFSRAVTAGFELVNGIRVGPEAHQLWRQGWRFTQSTRFSRAFDLRLADGDEASS